MTWKLNVVIASVWIYYVRYMIPKRVRDEEKMLARKFGAEYETYRGKVKKYVPFVW